MVIEIYRDSPERRRECLYYLAVGHYKLGNYGEARQFNQQLLKFEPNNTQAHALNKLITEKVSRGKMMMRMIIKMCLFIITCSFSVEGVIGLAIVSGVLAVGAALVAAIIKRRSSKQ